MVAVAVMLVFEASKVFVTTVPPTGVSASAVGALGATVSTTTALVPASEDELASAGRVITASFPEPSRIVPPPVINDVVLT